MADWSIDIWDWLEFVCKRASQRFTTECLHWGGDQFHGTLCKNIINNRRVNNRDGQAQVNVHKSMCTSQCAQDGSHGQSTMKTVSSETVFAITLEMEHGFGKRLRV